MAELTYRRDIDGLRAIAILPVVFFHLDVAGFSGGFVGVDVFFVISGYLITGILLREIREGRFSFTAFYVRRARRLFPALAVMLAVTFIAGFFILLPGDLRSMSHGMIAAVLFVANLYYWKTTDYFGDPVEALLLLHTWSLAVEEQFYLIFPVLMLCLLRFVPARMNLLLFVAFISSLLASQLALGGRSESAFYLTHLRAWEFLAGALLATGAVRSIDRQWLRDGLSLLGLLLILGSVFWLDKNSSFPGFSALPAVLGAAMLIHAGQDGRSSLGGHWLGWRPLVWVGLISYSLYLWHWPIFGFVKYYLVAPYTVSHQIALMSVVMGVSWLSWRFVEQPFRHPRIASGAGRWFRVTAVAAALLVIVALPISLTHGLPGRIPENVRQVAAVAKEDIPFRKACFGLKPWQIEQGAVCALGNELDAPRFLLWGDSHALALAPAVGLSASELGVGGRFLAESACPPLLATTLPTFRAGCEEFNAAVMNYLDTQGTITKVFLVGRWSRHLGIGEAKGAGTDRHVLDGLSRTLAALSERGMDVVIVPQVPEVPWDVPSVLARASLYGRPAPSLPSVQQYLNLISPFDQLLSAASRDYEFAVLELREAFCPDAFCMVEQLGQPLYRDSHHLSPHGAAYLRDVFAPSMRSLRTKEASASLFCFGDRCSATE